MSKNIKRVSWALSAITMFAVLFFVQLMTAYAAGNADLVMEGTTTLSTGQQVTLSLKAKNITGSKVMGIGAYIYSSDPTCFTVEDVESTNDSVSVTDGKVAYMSFNGTNNDLTMADIKIKAGNHSCTANIMMGDKDTAEGRKDPSSSTSGADLSFVDNSKFYRTYSQTITVSAPANNDATLSSLSPNVSSLNETFSSSNTNYTMTVPRTTSSVVFTATPNDPNAKSVTGTTCSITGRTNTCNIVVTAEDNTTNKTYKVTVTREYSHDADLTNLVPSTSSLNETFASGTTNYTMNVPSTVSDVTFTATKSFTSATVTGTSCATTNVTSTCTVHVVAEDGTTTKDYVVVITRAKSQVSTLSNLTSSYGTLSPTFASATTNYTLNVPTTITSINLNYTKTDNRATVTGDTTCAINAYPATTTCTLHVEAEDAAYTTDYNVTVTVVLSGDALLKTLTASTGTLSPAFVGTTNNYTLSVNSPTTSVTFNATVKDTRSHILSTSDLTCPITGNTATCVITVEAEDGTQNPYTITVNKILSSDNKLTSLVPSKGTLDPSFNSNTENYTLGVDSSTTSVNFTYTLSDATHAQVLSTSDTTCALNPYPATTTCNIVVKAENGDEKTYAVVVSIVLSTNKNLSALRVGATSSSLASIAGFVKNKTNYSITVPTSQSTFSVMAVAEDSAHAKITSTYTTTNTNTITFDQNLNYGSNIFTFDVEAEDGSTQPYTIEVIRTIPLKITSVTYGHTIDTDYILTFAPNKTAKDLKDELDQDNAILHVYKTDGTELSDSDPVGTGMTVKLIVNGVENDSKDVVVYGDTNGDGIINVMDSANCINHFLDRIPMSGAFVVAGDINFDGIINVIDASTIVNHFLDRIYISSYK